MRVAAVKDLPSVISRPHTRFPIYFGGGRCRACVGEIAGSLALQNEQHVPANSSIGLIQVIISPLVWQTCLLNLLCAHTICKCLDLLRHICLCSQMIVTIQAAQQTLAQVSQCTNSSYAAHSRPLCLCTALI